MSANSVFVGLRRVIENQVFTTYAEAALVVHPSQATPKQLR
jgi:hypothetical protein